MIYPLYIQRGGVTSTHRICVTSNRVVCVCMRQGDYVNELPAAQARMYIVVVTHKSLLTEEVDYTH